jgi:hypothetical protein
MASTRQTAQANPEESGIANELEKLRDELIGFEKIIAEFQKWKLIGLGAVFAAGLGFSEASNGTGFNAVLASFTPISSSKTTIFVWVLSRGSCVRLTTHSVTTND